MKVLLIAIFWQVILCCAATEQSLYICQGTPDRVKCGSGTKINIIKAFYDAQIKRCGIESLKCNEDKVSNQPQHNCCIGASFTAKAHSICDGKSNCSLHIRNNSVCLENGFINITYKCVGEDESIQDFTENDATSQATTLKMRSSSLEKEIWIPIVTTLSIIMIIILMSLWLRWCKNKHCCKTDNRDSSNKKMLVNETAQNASELHARDRVPTYEIVDNNERVTVDNVLYSQYKGSLSDGNETKQVVYNELYVIQSGGLQSVSWEKQNALETTTVNCGHEAEIV